MVNGRHITSGDEPVNTFFSQFPAVTIFVFFLSAAAVLDL